MTRPATLNDYRTLYAGNYSDPDAAHRHFGDNLPAIAAKLPCSIAEYGCGRGEFLRHMTTQYEGVRVAVGVDPVRNEAWDDIDGVTWYEGTCTDAPWFTADWVVSFDVLEHLREAAVPAAIEAMWRRARVGMWHAIWNGPDVHRINGELVELHLTQRDHLWWQDQFAAVTKAKHVYVRPATYRPDHRFIIEVIR